MPTTKDVCILIVHLDLNSRLHETIIIPHAALEITSFIFLWQTFQIFYKKHSRPRKQQTITVPTRCLWLCHFYFRRRY